ncbi:MAG: hypothetical protein A2X13_09650 [Bacteroidetes bacterium GWC2_33_15]|nr:MAG: hypothetical protein A2X10_10725 [Bacteroidetes bacterium GWA2_33_15]OFX48965.1 MAG: hypothetical protein A2X13_09650 [Bacteroidetes bacterium GWC2_33_15]OFX64771.1 MAG: hypothetical protein A2X15_05565 [Bacteroidetes bacterium GWB2_32_14]OFX68473.1 MAG: hypothetical protein A2X14_15120 [Bacteroidetes bacterium GWD2_33_33]HAN19198.1 hypothetical protein [Bacteroidales bacterium]
MRNVLNQSHPFSKFIFALFIILSVFLLIFLVGIIVALPIFHIRLAELPQIISNIESPGNLSFLKYLQTLQSVGLFIIPSFIIAFLFSNNSFSYLKFTSKANGTSLILIVFIMFCSVPIINFFAMWNADMHLPGFLKDVELWMREKESSAQQITEAFLEMNSIQTLFFNIFMIGVLPAIGEELIFRGIFQRLFTEWTKNIHWGILIAAILFSGMHMQFYGFVPRLLLGILFGYLFYWSGSIWFPIAGHFVNNTTAVVFYYFYADKVAEQIDSFGASEGTYYYLVISLILLTALLWSFYKNETRGRMLKADK